MTHLGALQTQSVAKTTARLNIVEGILLTVLSCVCRADRTMKGHVLGHPSARPKALVPERNLSPVVVGITRILMHCAMIEGACRHPQVCLETVICQTTLAISQCKTIIGVIQLWMRMDESMKHFLIIRLHNPTCVD